MTNTVSLFGFEKGYWEIFGAVGNWAAAFGSVLAAGVALWVANRGSSPVTKQSITIHEEIDGPKLVFRIVNTNDRSLRVTGIGWQIGRWPHLKQFRQHELQKGGSALPVDLAYGEEASWIVATNSPHLRSWTDTMLSGMLHGVSPRRFGGLRGVFYTSIQKDIKVRPNKAIVGVLRRRWEKQKVSV